MLQSVRDILKYYTATDRNQEFESYAIMSVRDYLPEDLVKQINELNGKDRDLVLLLHAFTCNPITRYIPKDYSKTALQQKLSQVLKSSPFSN